MQVQRKAPSAALAIAVISIPIFVGALDLTVVSAVLPQVLLDLEIPLSDFDKAAWIVTGYLLAYTVSMTFMGRLSDLYGRRRVFLAALIIFAVGSYLVAVSQAWPTRAAMQGYYLVAGGRVDPARISLGVLIASRVIQAFGAGAMVPVGMGLVGDLFPPEKRPKPLGVIAAIDTAGWVVGHLYGGIIVRYWTWQTIFWLNLPICLLTFIVIWYVLRDAEQPQSEGRMDWAGALLITLSLTAFIVGLGNSAEPSSSTSLGEQSAVPPYALPALLVALVFLGLFVWRQMRYKHPLFELSLFRKPNLSLAIAANFLVGFGLFIAIANVPLFINTLVAVTPEQGAWESGWVLSALTVPMAIAAVPGGWLTERTNYRLPAISGLIAAVVAFGLMTSWQQSSAYSVIIPQLMLAGIGFGFTLAPIAAAVVNASPEGYRGAGSALVIIFRLLGMTAGISSITTYGLYRMDVLATELLSANATLNELAQVGISATEMVISETFVIAGAACLLAIVPSLFLKLSVDKGNNSRD
jgi:MFS family permease